jgi:hypothetical protein
MLLAEEESVRGLVVVLKGLRLMELDNFQSHRGYLHIRDLINVGKRPSRSSRSSSSC